MVRKWFMMYQYYTFIINIFNILFSLCLHIVHTLFTHLCYTVFVAEILLVHIFAYSFSENGAKFDERSVLGIRFSPKFHMIGF